MISAQYMTSRAAARRMMVLLAVLSFVVVLAVSGVGAVETESASSDNDTTALMLSIDGAISPATMDYVIRGLQLADEQGHGVVVLQMDTPGGLMASMRGIIQAILLSPVPVAVYVAPSGARAASAGTYILYGSHIAAMAPATNLGSATPVMMGGLPGAPAEKDSSSSPAEDGKSKGQGENGEKEAGDSAGKEQGGSAMERKTMEDAVAYIRELAGRHGRNADWAERAVREAVNLGAAGALEKNVIDIVAADVDDLLAQMDGRSVVMEGGEQVLDTDGMQVIRHDPDWRTRLLSVITDPNIAYFLMLIGFYGIFFELANPGSLFPGVIGGICLILALFAFQVLSVNYAGLALILLGLGFIVAEAFLPSFGILGLGGIASFVVGSIILMDGSNLSVSLPMIGGTALVAAAFLLWALSRFISLRKRHSVSGIEQTSRQKAVVLDDFEDEEDQYRGAVRLAGERWKAVSKEPLEKGDEVRVERIDGLTAYVVKC